ncbi:class I adenylate-forming enzyme family protein [Methanosphaera sp. ISO3-F5]|uniref:class I adenylate-forming enzyme family protein n=1 Tax=Methanosphaera sp. ISO3-F5 TaxID=1452353 RepID=UPI002B263B7D|nr:class I adenylate-forming enzyme family protein [Methanosphaera sp. ISO3-F5]WQH63512.1 class I adenylate-forming enzyme family protein [Methanosphaera sp. ISO3-F5]
MINVTTFLDANACRLDKPVYYSIDKNKKYTSRDILGIISHLGRTLKKLGIKKQDRVVIYLENSPEYLFSFLALWRIGAVAVPTNRIYTIPELKYYIKDSGAKLIITDHEINEIDIPCYQIPLLDEYTNEKILEAENTSWDDLCQLQYTSGTTGKPKGAMLTHGNWFSAIHNECDVLKMNQDSVMFCIYPMAHVGISWAISALRAAALCITKNRYTFEEYLDIIYENSVTHATGMPPVIHSIVSNPELVSNKLYTVKCIISGGGPLHQDTWKKFYKKYGIPVLNAYGSSETIVIGTGTVIRPEDYASADKYESVGHPVCFTEIKIVDTEDPSKTLKQKETGEIALRGPSTTIGYWNNPQANKETFTEDGWYLSGDIGYIDDDQRLFITDRKKDMIIMSGWKIYPTEVEEVLIAHDSVDEIAIFSIPHEHRGEIPAAAVIWKEEPDEEGLLEYARQNLARYKIPRKIFTVTELPRVNNWKLLRKDLKEKLL